MERTVKYADTKGVKKLIPALALIVTLSALFPSRAEAYLVNYKEQYYRLYHVHYAASPDDIMENIYWLEKALNADFCNPLYALATITNETEWEKYRYLFTMHLYLKLIDQHIALGNRWNKRNAYFFNAPWKAQNLDSLNTAETCYKTAEVYWTEAQAWAQKALDPKFRWINLSGASAPYWQDEAARIESGKLDYGRTLNRELTRLQSVREAFEAMDDTTY